jgi:hypothetical protein
VNLSLIVWECDKKKIALTLSRSNNQKLMMKYLPPANIFLMKKNPEHE